MPRNHDWSHPDFKLIPAAIHIEQGSWLAARAVVGPGVTVGRGAVLCLGSVTGRSRSSDDYLPRNPAQPVKQRVISNQKHHYASDA